MSTPQRLAFLLLAAIPLAIVSHAAQASPIDTAQCEALAQQDFSTIPDAPTQISRARVIASAQEIVAELKLSAPPEYTAKIAKNLGTVAPFCRVTGYVAPSVGFELMLPMAHWNGKFLHLGCGGWCGATLFTVACASHPSYACIGTDMGHTGAGGLWFRNNLQAQIDFSYRATHVATLAGKAIVEHYYASAPSTSYFMGCSTGGYQALMEAQHFPWDFNGIIAGAPDMDEADLAVRGIWIKRNFLGKDGKPMLSTEDIELLHQAVLARCDTDDGVKDGIISDPMHCGFDPGTLQCKAGAKEKCLSAAQVEAVKNIYGPPRNSKGQAISTRGVMPGSELDWAKHFARVWGDMFFEDTALLSTPGKPWSYTDFDFDRDYSRSGAGVLFADTNPDLRKFKAAGGKLLSYQGLNDTAEIPGGIFDYYETVERTLGGREATQDFFRLFAIPGMNHCSGGDGVFAFDYLSYLEAWVEQGKVPDSMVGAHVSGLNGSEAHTVKIPLDPDVPVAFTRPVYPYPLYAKYKGKGDPSKAENFQAARPAGH